jgi:hypothetical protein
MTTEDASMNAPAQPFLLPIHLNALKFFSLEAPQPDWQDILRELSSMFGSAPEIDELKKRYQEATEEFQIFGVPSEPKIVSKLLEPCTEPKPRTFWATT